MSKAPDAYFLCHPSKLSFTMLAILSYVVLALSALLHVHAAPVDHDGLSVAARNILGLAARQDVAVSDASSGPRFVVYSDQHGGVNGPPPASKIKVRVVSPTVPAVLTFISRDLMSCKTPTHTMPFVLTFLLKRIGILDDLWSIRQTHRMDLDERGQTSLCQSRI